MRKLLPGICVIVAAVLLLAGEVMPSERSVGPVAAETALGNQMYLPLVMKPEPTPTATSTLTPTATRPPDADLLHANGTVCYVSGTAYSLGEVVNDTGHNVRDIRLRTTLYAEDDTVIGASSGSPSIDRLLPGQRSIYVFIAGNQAGWARSETVPTYGDVGTVNNSSYLAVSGVTETWVNGKLVGVQGQVTNDSGWYHSSVRVMGVFRAIDGSLTRIGDGYSTPTALLAGQTGTFRLYLSGCGPDAVQYEMYPIGQ